jgi:hypothetical protein
MRWIPVLVCSALMAGSAASAAPQTAPAKTAPSAHADSKPSAKETVTSVVLPPSPRALLPDALDGWVEAAPPISLKDAAQADPANAAALKEYDFDGGASVTYRREGETLNVRALRFQDASGAYGAYSFYRKNGWAKEDIGFGATSDHNRVLFWKGDTVVDATFSHIGPMSAGELRELANYMPNPPGTRALMPPILANLPQGSLDGQTTHYAIGAAGYAGGGGVLPPELVGFDRGAETVTATYSLSVGSGNADHHRLSHAADRRRTGSCDSRLSQGGGQGSAFVAQGAHRLRRRIARGAAQRTPGRAGERRRNSRREPPAARVGAL